MSGPTPAPLPLATETTCPRCSEKVTVVLAGVRADADPGRVELDVAYHVQHRCADLRGDQRPAPRPVPGARS